MTQMIRRLFVILLGALVLVIGCHEVPQRDGEVGDRPAMDGDDASDEGATLRPFITDGTHDYGHPTVGILASGSARCSATLIGKRTLTAGHCVKTSSVSFTVEGTTYAATQVIRHPGYGGGNRNDVAVVILQQQVAGLLPSPISTSPPQVGQLITLVGYGETGEYSGGFGTRLWCWSAVLFRTESSAPSAAARRPPSGSPLA
jgi:hypothetical protein